MQLPREHAQAHGHTSMASHLVSIVMIVDGGLRIAPADLGVIKSVSTHEVLDARAVLVTMATAVAAILLVPTINIINQIIAKRDVECPRRIAEMYRLVVGTLIPLTDAQSPLRVIAGRPFLPLTSRATPLAQELRRRNETPGLETRQRQQALRR